MSQEIKKADMGLVGLAVMGRNLALNINENGFTLAVYNRNKEITDKFFAGEAKASQLIPAYSLEELVSRLKSPRRVMLMIQAGDPVDQVIDSLIPLLEKGDIIIDGGNSHYPDTIRRYHSLEEKGIFYIGMGISGGEEGARFGPAIMPGGSQQAWDSVKNIYQAISAKVDDDPCCQWIGKGGAGHYVKMVHNGIEYGDMQLIAEAYQFMHIGLGLNHSQMRQIFTEWNEGVLNSYLIEITADILGVVDDDGEPLLEKILDTAGQKGTGTWTGISALEQGVPLTLIGEAVFARCLSSLKETRLTASKVYPRNQSLKFEGDLDEILQSLHDALYASKIISYAQGFMLMQQVSKEYGWNLDYGNIALTWRGGCIIRSQFLNKIKKAYDNNPQLDNLLMDDFFVGEMKQSIKGCRNIVQQATALEISVPAFSSALSFFDGYRSEKTSANMLQAQRDYFGAHTYERIDKERGEFFHTDWIKALD